MLMFNLGGRREGGNVEPDAEMSGGIRPWFSGR